MTKKHKPPKPTTQGTAYPPEEVTAHFDTIRASLDYVQAAYNELASAPAPTPTTFQVWDSTAPGYLEAQGLPRLKCPSESNFFPGSARGAPDLDWIAENAVPKFTEDPLAIDIECYGKKDVEGEHPYTEEEIGWLTSVVKTFHDERPEQRVGIYMTPPERYGGCSGSGYQPGGEEYEERWGNWTDRNAVMAPLADEADMMFPSLYGLYSDMEQWVRFAQQNVEQTRMLTDKPIIGYLWPEWHNNAEKTGRIGYDDWMTMLETCLPICDGIAIWDWSSQRFDPEAPWWKATEDFMKRHHLNGR